MKTTNYSTLAFINKPTFKDMCQQFPDLEVKMKENLKKYQDRLKLFCKLSLKEIPYLKKLSEKSLEEITYHLKQKYYDANDIIFRAGDAVEDIDLITRGEVDLILNVDNHDLVLHNLYQGCYMGGYKALSDNTYAHTARAVTNVTIHSLSKDSISLLQKNLSDFNTAIENAKGYIERTEDPIIGFGLFRYTNKNLNATKILKMAVIKVLKINRDLKEAGIKEKVSGILERMVIGYYNEEEEERKPHNYQKTSIKLLNKVLRKIEGLEDKVENLETKFEKGNKQAKESSNMLQKYIDNQEKSNLEPSRSKESSLSQEKR